MGMTEGNSREECQRGISGVKRECPRGMIEWECPDPDETPAVS